MSLPKKVVYLALGPLRTTGARTHAARLAATGATVRLIVNDLPEWAGAELPAGVTLHRITAPDSRAMIKTARRLLFARGGPLADADLLIAGDPQSMPVAWDALRRRPDLAVHLEPVEDPSRRPGPADLAVVTPWYPSENNALAGAFVKAAIGAVAGEFARVSILHTEDWAYPYDSKIAQLVGVAAQRLTDRCGQVTVRSTPEGELTRCTVPISSRRDYAAWATAHANALAASLPTGVIEAPLIHAHTGIYGGVAAVRLARPDARIVVTEHATFLPQVFKQPAARKLYDEMLSRVDVLLCVGGGLHQLISQQFPHHAAKLRIVPNAIDFDDFAWRPEPPREPLRWLYVGRLSEHKGVRPLLEAFARISGEKPTASLTLVGSGALEDELRTRVRELELTERVRLLPAVPPDQVAGLMHRHDLLVHASRMETFGMTVVEAIATGTPVLVARSEGPLETLAGLDGVAGRLFDISDDPEVIVEAYRELDKRFDQLDLAAARESLLARYGRVAVGAQLMDAYRGSPTAAGPSEPVVPVGPAAVQSGVAPSSVAPTGERTVVVAISPPNFNLVRDFVHRLLGLGIAVDVITNDPKLWQRSAVDERIRLLPLDAAERRRPVLRAERLLVYRAPGKVLSVARDRARRRDAIWPELAVSNLQRVHGKLAKSFHSSVFYGGYRVVRPRVLWRIVQRDILPKLDLARTSRVVVSGVYGVAIGWQLARRHPELTVTTALVTPESD
ncbi:glycosyltransferase family 4 protein [Micromonospora sp. CPCC 206060]|uniref:glycosyltransferase family 4 protein n=1 Tax=Micromonospora sp. CPCC 206060 TaxID=3122406 RepID=UPI002FF0E271